MYIYMYNIYIYMYNIYIYIYICIICIYICIICIYIYRKSNPIASHVPMNPHFPEAFDGQDLVVPEGPLRVPRPAKPPPVDRAGHREHLRAPGRSWGMDPHRWCLNPSAPKGGQNPYRYHGGASLKWSYSNSWMLDFMENSWKILSMDDFGISHILGHIDSLDWKAWFWPSK